MASAKPPIPAPIIPMVFFITVCKYIDCKINSKKKNVCITKVKKTLKYIHNLIKVKRKKKKD
jgi:hypothetical protein